MGVRTQRAPMSSRSASTRHEITTEVYLALYEGKPPSEAVGSLLGRTLRPERD